MTKTEVREWLKRIREDVRGMEQALRRNDARALLDFAQDASGSAAEIETALTDDYIGTGVRGMTL